MGMLVPLFFCFLKAAAIQGVPTHVLFAMHEVEGGREGTVSVNTDGSRDLGVMQVNTVHLPRLASLYRRPLEEIEVRLRDDGCWNVHVAAWELARRIEARNGDLWAGVGDYHSNTPEFHLSYRQKVRTAYERIKREGWLDTILSEESYRIETVLDTRSGLRR